MWLKWLRMRAGAITGPIKIAAKQRRGKVWWDAIYNCPTQMQNGTPLSCSGWLLPQNRSSGGSFLGLTVYLGDDPARLLLPKCPSVTRKKTLKKLRNSIELSIDRSIETNHITDTIDTHIKNFFLLRNRCVNYMEFHNYNWNFKTQMKIEWNEKKSDFARKNL